MAETKWIRIATNIFDNRKIKMLEAMPNGDSIVVIWIKLLALAGTVNENGLVYFTETMPYSSEMLATEFNRPLTTVKLAIETFKQFGMIEITNDIIRISNWEKYQNIDGLAKIREQNRLRQQKHRQQLKLECHVTSNVTDNVTKAKSNVTSHVTNGKCHVTDNVTSHPSNAIDIDKDIDININNISNEILLSDNEKNLSDEEEIKSITKQIESIIEQWNTLEEYGIKSIRIVGPNTERGKMLRARLKQYGPDSFAEVVQQIKESDFLQGKHDGRPWQVDFDWIVHPNNYPKVLEGKYKGRYKPQPVNNRARNFVCIENQPEDFEALEKTLLDN